MYAKFQGKIINPPSVGAPRNLSFFRQNDLVSGKQLICVYFFIAEPV